MKLVVLDGYTENPGDLSWAELAALGELTVYDRTSYTESPLIAERIGDAEIVVMNKTPISRATIDACPNIRLIAVLATGYNVVDYNYAREKGIPVVNVPAYGTASVSQYSIALLLEICHHIGHHSASVHAGNWASNPDWCYWDYPLIELEGKTIGIIGFGRIGQAEGRIARAMGMHVLAYDVYPNDAGRAIGAYVDLDTLLAQADVVSLHCNLTPENTGLINKENIAKMKDGAILINNARGQLIVEQDVADALNSGKVAQYFCDFPTEELLGVKGVCCTPHLGASTPESETNCAVMAAAELSDYLKNGNITHSVNLPDVSQPRVGGRRICIIHKNAPGAISAITGVLTEAHLNIENMVNKSKKDVAYTLLDVTGNVTGDLAVQLRAIESAIRVRVL